MKFTIDTEVLKRHGLSLGEFLLMLMGYHEVDYEGCTVSLKEKGLAWKSAIGKVPVVLSDQQKEIVASILMESEEVIQKAPIDFTDLACKLQELYPEGIKPGTTYKWRGTAEEIAQKLRVLWIKYRFVFTEDEAIQAVNTYLQEFKDDEDKKHMSILKYFLLKTYRDQEGTKEIVSQFMSYIEIIRDKKEKNENHN